MSDLYIEWAKRAAGILGWFPETVYSQWALETGWFKSNNFKSNNNIAGQTWYEGCGYPKGTPRSQREGGFYIKYPDPVTGYIDFITRNSRRYGKVKEFRTVEGQFQAIKDAGWAVDDAYVTKLIAVYRTVQKKGYFENRVVQVPKKVTHIQPLSLVDYLRSKHRSTDFESRRRLSVAFGIVKDGREYSGTSEQNERLLKVMLDRGI